MIFGEIKNYGPVSSPGGLFNRLLAGCDDRANAAHSQKTRRPEGFQANRRLAAPWAKTQKGDSPASRLAIHLFARKQHPSEF